MAEEISYHLSEDQERVNGKKSHKAYSPNLFGSLRIITTTTTAKAIEEQRSTEFKPNGYTLFS